MMVATGSFLAFLSVLASSFALGVALETRKRDPCAKVGGQKWVAPSAVRACFQSIPVNQTIKANVSFVDLCYFDIRLIIKFV